MTRCFLNIFAVYTEKNTTAYYMQSYLAKSCEIAVL